MPTKKFVQTFVLLTMMPSAILWLHRSMPDTNCTSAHEDAKHLVKSCRTGRLYELEKWIASGRSFEVPSAKFGTLLQVAVETGFHSLIESIAKHENDQSSKNAALADAGSLFSYQLKIGKRNICQLGFLR
jgi:hypothetical protein